jgi:hypothetical protein
MKATSSRVIAVPVTAILAAVVLAACGGGSSSTTTSTSSSPSASAGATAGAPVAASRAKLTACLKKYGVTLPSGGVGGRRFGATGATGPFRRPGATGRRFFGATGGTGTPGTGFPPGGAGGFAANPKFAAAYAKCGGAAGVGGGFGRGRFGATGASGVGGVASPQYRAEVTSYAACMNRKGVRLPTPNFTGTGFVFGTKVNRTTSKFIAANAKCESLLAAPAAGGTTG